MEVMKEVKMKRYDAYKDSGINWLGDIPEGWNIKRFKFLFQEVNERSEDGSGDLLSVSQYTGVTKKSDNIDDGDLITTASTLEGYKKVYKNDLVSNIMLAWNGSLGFSPFNGITSPAYSVYRLNQGNSEKFFHYLVRSGIYKAEFKRNSTGVIESRLRLYTDDFYNIWSILPPLPEQTAIATYLDEKTAKIDQAIAQKEKLIELLKERKQILIQELVTGKKVWNEEKNVWTEPAEVVDSGVEWIGEIPKGWEVTKLKYHTKQIVDGAHFTPTYVESGVPFLRVTDISSEFLTEIDWTRTKFIPEREHKELIKRANPEKGDVLLSKNGTIGLTRVIDWDQEFSFFVSLCLLKFRDDLDPYFFCQFFDSPLVDMQITFGSSRTSVTNLHLEKIKELLIVLPPREIQAVLTKEMQRINNRFLSVIKHQISQMNKLKEYKAVLIDSAVTGKLRVPSV